jgi:hypothetical protein
MIQVEAQLLPFLHFLFDVCQPIPVRGFESKPRSTPAVNKVGGHPVDQVVEQQ